MSETAPVNVTVEQGAEFAHLKLPASRSEVWFRAEGGMDPAIWLSFRAPRADVERFLTESGFPPLREGHRSIQVGAEKELDWSLDQLSDYAGAADTVNGVMRQVMVDHADPAAWHVYLFAFRTSFSLPSESSR
ncbi:hypothetical protein C3Y87_20390 [Carbonactinospora thermoautotrophica]|uniref:Uncharacterized protein n=2 Tax=Carbonactinospora thermoautotrophica TaxID=1469144 RepID=A0A132N4G5_9ACTN|nr:hypothetical protein TH66_04220 [Carbonactinospora thermoautotrophica]KWX08940.1 hypothetical protein TR74_12600 [Carbonactinospora thermoautotrophica]MCX9193697.1 hypothetical protein [Carbonactinospora thermoautotrophica]